MALPNLGDPLYNLTPPSVEVKFGSDSLWGKVKMRRGKALVIYKDGRITAEDVAPSHADVRVEKVWLGGHTYVITDAEADLLRSAGYGACLEEIV